MATKTISIDTEAYRRLKAVKREGESFSEVIKRVVELPLSAEEWFAEVRKLNFSKEFLDGVETAVTNRRPLRSSVNPRRAAS